MALHVTKEDGTELVLLGVDEYISTYTPDGWQSDPKRKKSLRNAVYQSIKNGQVRTVKNGFRKVIRLEL